MVIVYLLVVSKLITRKYCKLAIENTKNKSKGQLTGELPSIDSKNSI